MRFEISEKKLAVFFIIFILFTDFFIVWNIFYVRQIFGFLFLTIFPGTLICLILQVKKISLLDRILLSWGLSISFIMLSFLLLNTFFFMMNFDRPLSKKYILIFLNLTYFIFLIVYYIRGEKIAFTISSDFYLKKIEMVCLILSSLFPLLSIYGLYLINYENQNYIILMLLFLISLDTILVSILFREHFNNAYIFTISSISISLLLLLSLRSNYIIGNDVNFEFNIFSQTLENMRWQVLGNTSLSACLSISILPTIYYHILGISTFYLFKILYSLLYMVSPLIIYSLSKKYMPNSYAFLASCFFMFQPAFLWTEYNARTNLAVLFFALIFMTLFSREIDLPKRGFIFLNLSIACIFSHYTTAYILLFYSVVFSSVIKFIPKMIGINSKIKISPKKSFLLFVIIFVWYSQINEHPFNSGVVFIYDTITSLARLLIFENRGRPAQALLGEGFTRGYPFIIQFASTWSTFILIAVGLIFSIYKYMRNSLSRLNIGSNNGEFKAHFEILDFDYLLFGIFSATLCLLMIVVPILSTGYGIERAYSAFLVFLSPFFIIGGVVVGSFLNSHIRLNRNINSKIFKIISADRLVILILLIIYFLSITGAIHEIFDVHYQITLSSDGKLYDDLYVHDQEINSGFWLKNTINKGDLIFVDDNFRLVALGLETTYNREIFEGTSFRTGYIYLRYTNVLKNKFLRNGGISQEINYQILFYKADKIYDNSGSQIFKVQE